MATATLHDLKKKLNKDFVTSAFSVSANGEGLVLGPPPSDGTPNMSVSLPLGGTDDKDVSVGSLKYIGSVPVVVEMFGGFPISITYFSLGISKNPNYSGPSSGSPPQPPTVYTIDVSTAAVDVTQTGIQGTIQIPAFFTGNSPSPPVDMIIVAHTPDPSNNPQPLDIAFAPVQSNLGLVAPDGNITIAESQLIGSVRIVLQYEFSSMHLEIRPDQQRYPKLFFKGNLTITTSGYPIHWPEVTFMGLGVDSRGNVEMDDQWFKLPKHTGIDITPFTVDLQKVGFGIDPYGVSSASTGSGSSAPPTRHRWIGFDGGVKLHEGITIKGSVKGMRLNIDDSQHPFSFNGIKLGLKIPDVLEVKGELDHIYATDQNDMKNQNSPITVPENIPDVVPNSSPPYSSISPYPLNLFLGKLDVKLPSLKVEAGADILIGRVEASPKFNGATLLFIFLDVSFPGIPIFTDVSLFELAGFFALDLRPDPTQPDGGVTHTWWDWFKYPTLSSGTIDTTATVTYDPKTGQSVATDPGTGKPIPGVYTATDPLKWIWPQPGAMAFGAGAGIGTSADSGYTASANLTLVLMFPGPVIMLIGKGNVLHARGTIQNEAPFDAMATLDLEAKSFMLALGVTLDLLDIIKIHGDAEVYANWDSNPSDNGWYFALGKPPHEQRISANILSLFTADTYFVISDSGLITGSYVGLQMNWSFGPLGVKLNAFIASLLAMNWAPLQVGGGMEWHGEVELEAFGIGLGITIDALVEASAPNPFWVHGEFTVSLDLPWPLPDIGATVGLTWGSNDGSVPPAPLALSRIDAFMRDHAHGADHYNLLAHRKDSFEEPGAVVYDAASPGLLGLNSSNDTSWKKLVGNTANLDHSAAAYDDALKVLPPLVPGNSTTTDQYAPVIPADAHFTLTFARPTVDKAGFSDSQPEVSFPPDITASKVPSILPADDMSHLEPNPPTPQWRFRHLLRQVALYEYINGAWQLLSSTPSLSGSLDLPGAWLLASAVTSGAKAAHVAPGSKTLPNTVLKVAPYNLQPQQGGPAMRVHALPDSPALYALKTVTRIEACRMGSNAMPQRVPDGDPIIEFAYFQTAGGPGLAALSDAIPSSGAPPLPDPVMLPPFPNLAANANVPASRFPAGGMLKNLNSYIQWSWPDAGQVAAYYGYDLNVEFNEDNVNYFYASLDGGSILNALRLRCVDRNHRHTYLRTLSIRPPALPKQTAVIAGVMTPDLPQAVQRTIDRPIDIAQRAGVTDGAESAGSKMTYGTLSPGTLQALSGVLRARSGRLMHSKKLTPQLTMRDLAVLDSFATHGGAPIDAGNVSTIERISSEAADRILLLLAEIEAAQQVEDNWFALLRPRTFYSIDVVAGDSDGGANAPTSAPSAGTLADIRLAKDAIGAWNALQAYYAAEEARTSLYHFEFTTSRYPTFSDHLAPAAAQDPAASLSPMATNAIRRFVTSISGEGWFSANRSAYDVAEANYTLAVSALASLVSNFDPAGDYFNSPNNGERDLKAQRTAVDSAWQDFNSAVNGTYDGLITAFGRPELARGHHAPPPRQAELSFFTSSDGLQVSAILLESAEPFLWRRMWQWVTLLPADSKSRALQGVMALWSIDGTRALFVPLGQPAGEYTLTLQFMGDIGAEAPAITRYGDAVAETVSMKPVQLAPYFRYPLIHGGGITQVPTVPVH